MTRVQMRVTALLAVLALAACCAFAIGMAQKAYADTTVTAARNATALDYAKKRTLSAVSDSYFNSSVSSKYYKFTTSDRNSSYRIMLGDLEQQDIGVFLYHADGRIIDEWSTEDRLKRTYDALDRSATYYIELRRETNVTSRADFKITFKEIVSAPDPMKKFKVKSYKSGEITVKATLSSKADGFQVRTKRAWGDQTKATTLRAKKGATSVTYKTTYTGSKRPYKISVRPYRLINGKYYYGDWTNSKTIRVKS